jgi:hypothetical protein
MKVFEWSLRSLGHLDGDEGDNLLGKMVPCAVVSHPLRRLHGSTLWEGGREVEGKVMQVRVKLDLLHGCLCVYKGGEYCEA